MITTPRDLLEFLREEKEPLELKAKENRHLTAKERAILPFLRLIWRLIDWEALSEWEDFADIEEAK